MMLILKFIFLTVDRDMQGTSLEGPFPPSFANLTSISQLYEQLTLSRFNCLRL